MAQLAGDGIDLAVGVGHAGKIAGQARGRLLQATTDDGKAGQFIAQRLRRLAGDRVLGHCIQAHQPLQQPDRLLQLPAIDGAITLLPGGGEEAEAAHCPLYVQRQFVGEEHRGLMPVDHLRHLLFDARHVEQREAGKYHQDQQNDAESGPDPMANLH